MLSIYYDSDMSSRLGSEIAGEITLMGKKKLVLFLFDSSEKFFLLPSFIPKMSGTRITEVF